MSPKNAFLKYIYDIDKYNNNIYIFQYISNSSISNISQVILLTLNLKNKSLCFPYVYYENRTSSVPPKINLFINNYINGLVLFPIILKPNDFDLIKVAYHGFLIFFIFMIIFISFSRRFFIFLFCFFMTLSMTLFFVFSESYIYFFD